MYWVKYLCRKAVSTRPLLVAFRARPSFITYSLVYKESIWSKQIWDPLEALVTLANHNTPRLLNKTLLHLSVCMHQFAITFADGFQKLSFMAHIYLFDCTELC